MKVFIHAGVPKTASRFLETCLWKRHSEIALIFSDKKSQNALSSIAQHDTLEFNSDNLAVLSPPKIEKKAGVATHITLSSIGGADRALRVKRIFDALPNAHLIFTIRNQFDRFRSLYAMSYQRGVDQGIRKFPSLDRWAWQAPNIAPTNSVVKWRRPADVASEESVIYEYINVFGMEKVCVLPMEWIQQNPELFSKRLSHFLGVNKEETLSCLRSKPIGQRVKGGKLNIRTMRSSSFLTRAARKCGLQVPEKLIDADTSMSKELESHIREQSAPWNKRLASDFDLPLKELGYPF